MPCTYIPAERRGRGRTRGGAFRGTTSRLQAPRHPAPSRGPGIQTRARGRHGGSCRQRPHAPSADASSSISRLYATGIHLASSGSLPGCSHRIDVSTSYSSNTGAGGGGGGRGGAAWPWPGPGLRGLLSCAAADAAAAGRSTASTALSRSSSMPAAIASCLQSNKRGLLEESRNVLLGTGPSSRLACFLPPPRASGRVLRPSRPQAVALSSLLRPSRPLAVVS